MFLRSMSIASENEIIRNIAFKKGINLIIDESEGEITGNSVGKTTVLKLIDFCFGADKKIIWEDPENKKQDYTLVKNFLISNNVTVTLTLCDNLDDLNSDFVIIERNFITQGKKTIRRINGQDILDKDYDETLKKIFYPMHSADKPTFRQIISHNIRYDDLSLIHTLRTLDRFTTDIEYETLHLFMLGCEFTRGNRKIEITEALKQEEVFRNRLENNQTKSGYEATLSLLENEIRVLNEKKASLNINENLENDLDKLNVIKNDINKTCSEIGKLTIRKNIIIQSKSELEDSRTEIDIIQLKQIYEQAGKYIPEMQKTFDELVAFHNSMISEKLKYITNDLPVIDSKLSELNDSLRILIAAEAEATKNISQSDTFEELETLIVEMNKKYELKGEIESIIEQLKTVEESITSYNDELNEIDDELFSEEFENIVRRQVNKFNKYFSSVSESLYDEQYALKYDIVVNKKGQRLYKFSPFVPFGPNVASGKKQGEISSFDIAYIDFAIAEHMPCMKFLLNDKKELMHDNQLVKIASLVEKQNIQFVASMLKDKLPTELKREDFFILKLSEKDKLFKIE